MKNKSIKNLGPFMFTLGVCGMITSIGLLIFSGWEWTFVLLSGAFVSIFGFRQIKEAKSNEKTR